MTIICCFSCPFFDLGDIILLVSPVVPPRAYGAVLSACARRGFVLQGVRQLQLSAQQGFVLGMTAGQVLCPLCSGLPLLCSKSCQHCSSECLRTPILSFPALCVPVSGALAAVRAGFCSSRKIPQSLGLSWRTGM